MGIWRRHLAIVKSWINQYKKVDSYIHLNIFISNFRCFFTLVIGKLFLWFSCDDIKIALFHNEIFKTSKIDKKKLYLLNQIDLWYKSKIIIILPDHDESHKCKIYIVICLFFLLFIRRSSINNNKTIETS